jgi:hypothetical protein
MIPTVITFVVFVGWIILWVLYKRYIWPLPQKRRDARPNALQRVQAGALFLDEQMPGWEKRINVGYLDMLHPRYCILGQLFGYYFAGQSRLQINTPEEAVRLGFLCENKKSIRQFRESYFLECAWTDLICQRQKQA